MLSRHLAMWRSVQGVCHKEILFQKRITGLIDILGHVARSKLPSTFAVNLDDAFNNDHVPLTRSSATSRRMISFVPAKI